MWLIESNILIVLLKNNWISHIRKCHPPVHKIDLRAPAHKYKKYQNVNVITKAVLHELMHEVHRAGTLRTHTAWRAAKKPHDKRGWQVSFNQCQLINFVCYTPAPTNTTNHHHPSSSTTPSRHPLTAN